MRKGYRLSFGTKIAKSRVLGIYARYKIKKRMTKNKVKRHHPSRVILCPNGDPKENGDDTSPTVPKNTQSLVVPVDICPQSTSDTDNERNNDSESDDRSSCIPVETPQSTATDSEVNNYVDTGQRDTMKMLFWFSL